LSVVAAFGWSRVVGTSSGNRTIPIRDSGIGNGAGQVREALVRRAVDVDLILLEDDGGSSARPMISARRVSSLPHMKGGAMPTYAIHHYAAMASKPVCRPKGARRIAMSARAASVATRRTMRRAA
jgi:hypothetical protein